MSKCCAMEKLKQSAVLTPAIFLLLVWIAVMSGQCQLSQIHLIIYAALSSFVMAYLLASFIQLVRKAGEPTTCCGKTSESDTPKN